MHTHMKFFNFSKLARADGASTVVRVAMVCNDLAIANSSLGHFKNLSENSLNHVRQGGATVLCSNELRAPAGRHKSRSGNTGRCAMSALVTRCDAPALVRVCQLCECFPTGKQHAEFQRYIPSVRDKTAFHHDTTEIREALEYRTKHHSNSLCAMTIGEDIRSCRFDFADVVTDTIVCRKLWAIPIGRSSRSGSNLRLVLHKVD